MKSNIALFLVAGLIGVPELLFAQELATGKYSGSYEYNTPNGILRSGMSLVIDSVEGGLVKGTATSSSKGCNGDFHMEGKLEGKQLTLRLSGAGGRANCKFGLNLSVQGGKLVGTTTGGDAVEMSK